MAQGVAAGAHDVVIAVGVESMSRVPMGTTAMGKDPYGPKVAARYSEGLVNQGISAELVAARWKLDRETLDAYSAESHRRAVQAAADGFFDHKVVPIDVTAADGSVLTHRADETVRASTTTEGLAGLRPAFRDEVMTERFAEIDWKITPGNSSPLTDGASAVLIMSEEAAA